MPPIVIKKIEHLFKRIIFWLLKSILREGNHTFRPTSPEKIKSLLILRPDKLGDMIATVPAIHALKKQWPHIRLEIIASPQNKIIIKQDPLIDAIHVYSKNIFADANLICRLRKRKFDIIYDPICHDSMTGLLLAKLIAPKAILAASRKLKFLSFYDYCEPYQPDGNDHNIDNGLLIFNLFGVSLSTIDPFSPPFIPLESVAIGSKFLSELPKGNIKIGLNIAAGRPSRTLPIEKYMILIKLIAAEFPQVRFVIFCTMDERNRGEALAQAFPDISCLIPKNLSILDVAAILRDMKIFISPDTSLIHIAGLMRVPLVAMYSGHLRNYYFWRPYQQDGAAVIARNYDNLHDIEPEQIAALFADVYGRHVGTDNTK
jgi:ADP-heptose:LPS heptosyltransferase